MILLSSTLFLKKNRIRNYFSAFDCQIPHSFTKLHTLPGKIEYKIAAQYKVGPALDLNYQNFSLLLSFLRKYIQMVLITKASITELMPFQI